ncbi:MAG TPA: NAD(P)-dependent oxidoreductase [Solirubrobacteraceae bacterium]
MTDQIQVAVLGAGSTMGLPMARNIARSGMKVRGWNRTIEKASSLEDDGVQVCETPRDAAAGANVILTMLADGDAVIDAVEHAIDKASDDVLWLQMSTIGEAATDRCAEVAQSHSLTLIDAPVLGTKQPAEDGKLVVLASGPADARARVQPIFDAVGQKTIWVGEAGAGTRLKMVANSWVLTVTEGTAETIALAEGLGLDPQLFLDAVEGGALDLPYLRMKGKAIIGRDFEASFRLRLAAKDARLIEESAQRHDIDVPLFSTIRRRLAEGAKEHGDKDFCATYLTSAPKESDRA